MPDIDLEDACALVARAEKHSREFRDSLHGPGLSRLWRIAETFDPITAEWCYRAVIDHRRLVNARPILADAASNIVSALDHVAAACARANGGKREGLYFPKDRAGKEMKKLAGRIGDHMTAVIEKAMDRYELAHVRAVREIANSGKHWQLMVSNGSLNAVAWETGPDRRFFDLPTGALENGEPYLFLRSKGRMPSVPITVLVGLRLGGLSEDFPPEPETNLTCSLAFVRGVINAVADAARGGVTIRHTIEPGSGGPTWWPLRAVLRNVESEP